VMRQLPPVPVPLDGRLRLRRRWRKRPTDGLHAMSQAACRRYVFAGPGNGSPPCRRDSRTMMGSISIPHGSAKHAGKPRSIRKRSEYGVDRAKRR
jgi:hypothetical protein